MWSVFFKELVLEEGEGLKANEEVGQTLAVFNKQPPVENY